MAFVALEEGVSSLQEGRLPGGQEVGAEGVPAARLGRRLDSGQDLQDDLGLELGRESAASLHTDASPFGPPGSLYTCPIRGAHYRRHRFSIPTRPSSGWYSMTSILQSV